VTKRQNKKLKYHLRIFYTYRWHWNHSKYTKILSGGGKVQNKRNSRIRNAI